MTNFSGNNDNFQINYSNTDSLFLSNNFEADGEPVVQPSDAENNPPAAPPNTEDEHDNTTEESNSEKDKTTSSDESDDKYSRGSNGDVKKNKSRLRRSRRLSRKKRKLNKKNSTFNIVQTNDEEYSEESYASEIETVLKLLKDSQTCDDLSKRNVKYMNELNWSSNMTQDDVDKYKPIYNKICNDISIMPKISDILTTSMPYEEKCDIIEKILILNNAQPNTFEFMQLKKYLMKIIDKYKMFGITDEDYERYKNIEDELNKQKKTAHIPLKYKILDSKLSMSNKAYLFERYKYLSNMDYNNSEYNKLKNWIDTVLALPTEIKEINIDVNSSPQKINKYLYNVKKMLDSEIYGLQSVKEKILFLLNNRITNKTVKGTAMALVGPPGTAKTSIINILSKAIDLPIFQISIGGAKDSSFLVGHSYTYEGATPGAIVQAMQSMGYKNGIIYFDEFDKISKTQYGLELSRTLLHITDFTQNDKFHDRYLSNCVDIDLSNIWFVYSLNDKSLLDRTLSDRIPIIEVDGYDTTEKLHIAENYLIPKTLQNINLDSKYIEFTNEAIHYLINISNIDVVKSENGKSGVRQLKHLIEHILMKINLLKSTHKSSKNNKYSLDLSFSIKDFKLPLKITPEILKQLDINPATTNESYKHIYM